MKVEDVLYGAAEILADPERWYKRGWFADHDSLSEARSFCVLGACGKALGFNEVWEISDARHSGLFRRVEETLRSAGRETYPSRYRFLYGNAIAGSGDFNVPAWNDAVEIDHAEMLALLAKARKYAVERIS